MKKGLSPIVSVVLLVLIVVVVGIIIYGFSLSFVEKQVEETEGLSFYYDAKIKDVRVVELGALPSGPAVSSVVPSEIMEIAVERVDNEQGVNGVEFVFYNENVGRSYSIEIMDPPNTAGIAKIYKICNEQPGIEDFSKIDKVSISLIYGQGQSTDVLDEYEV